MSIYYPYEVRHYLGEIHLVHGPTLPDLGAMFQTEQKARDFASCLQDAFIAGADCQLRQDERVKKLPRAAIEALGADALLTPQPAPRGGGAAT